MEIWSNTSSSAVKLILAPGEVDTTEVESRDLRGDICVVIGLLPPEEVYKLDVGVGGGKGGIDEDAVCNGEELILMVDADDDGQSW